MRQVQHITTVVLASIAVTFAVWALVPVIARAALPYQLDYEEGNILNAAVRLAHGMSPYPAPHSWPSVLNPYGPVMYTAMAALIKLLGVSLWPGRLLVIASGGWIAVSLALILRRLTGSAVIGVAFGGIFLCSAYVQFWWPLLRVDIPGLALSLAGLYIFHRNPKRLWPAAFLFVTAFYTKHTLLAAPAACFVWTLLEGQKREAGKLLGVCLLLGGGAFVVLELWTRGAFGFSLFLTHPDPYAWSAYPQILSQVVETNSLLVILAAVLVIFNIRQKKLSLPILYLGFSALTTLTIGKAGSNSNHILELMASLCLAAGAGWSCLMRLEGVWQAVPLAIALLIGEKVVDNSRSIAFEPRNSGCEQVIALLHQQHADVVLSENTGAVVLAGKTPLISNTFVYAQLVRYGGWNDGELVKALQSGMVPVVVVDAARRQAWSKEVTRAMGDHYRVVQSCDCRYAGLILKPKGGGDQRAWDGEGNSRKSESF